MILETLRSIPVPDVHHDLRRVLAIISRLGEDTGMKTTSQEKCILETKIIVIIITTMRARVPLPMRLVLEERKRKAKETRGAR